jgi:hypothetical protein
VLINFSSFLFFFKDLESWSDIEDMPLEMTPYESVRIEGSSSNVKRPNQSLEVSNGSAKRQRRLRICDRKDKNGNWLVPHIPLPRIPKRDIRRTYAMILTNVYNSGDQMLLKQFVSQMITEDYNYRLVFDGKCYELVRGKKNIFYHFCYEHMLLSPDVVFAFNADRIKVRSDGTATLMGKFNASGNMIFCSPYEEKLAKDDHQMSPSFRISGNRIVYLGDEIHESGDNSASKEDIGETPISDSGLCANSDNPEDFLLYSQPKVADFIMTGSFRMTVDMQARIEEIDLHLMQYLLNRVPAKPSSNRSAPQSSQLS